MLQGSTAAQVGAPSRLVPYALRALALRRWHAIISFELQICSLGWGYFYGLRSYRTRCLRYWALFYAAFHVRLSVRECPITLSPSATLALT